MITDIDAKLLEKIADLTGKPVGAFNIRKDSGCEARQSTEHIEITPKTCLLYTSSSTLICSPSDRYTWLPPIEAALALTVTISS